MLRNYAMYAIGIVGLCDFIAGLWAEVAAWKIEQRQALEPAPDFLLLFLWYRIWG